MYVLHLNEHNYNSNNSSSSSSCSISSRCQAGPRHFVQTLVRAGYCHSRVWKHSWAVCIGSEPAFHSSLRSRRRRCRLFFMVGRSATLVCSFYLAVFVTVFHLFLSSPYLHSRVCACASVCLCVNWMRVCPLSSTVIGHWQRSGTAHRDLWFPIGGGFWWLGVRAQ